MQIIKPYSLLITLLGALLNSAWAETSVTLQGTEVYYNGGLTQEANHQVFELFKSAEKKPETLIINSSGGEIHLGLELGEWIFNNQISVKVNELCFSSCANYVFVAGINKYLGEKALVGFHGGSNSEKFIMANVQEILAKVPEEQRKTLEKDIQQQLEEYLAKNKIRETQFYNTIGVNKSINILGQAKAYAKYDEQNFNGWYYSLDCLKKLGVSNVITDKNWAIESKAKELKVFKISENCH